MWRSLCGTDNTVQFGVEHARVERAKNQPSAEKLRSTEDRLRSSARGNHTAPSELVADRLKTPDFRKSEESCLIFRVNSSAINEGDKI